MNATTAKADSLRYLERLQHWLSDFPSQPEFVPEHLRTNQSGNGRILLHFESRVYDSLGTLRFTGIDGPAVRIFSAMIFPFDPQRLPVFAAEFVILGRNLRAAVIDLQPLASRTFGTDLVLRRLGERHRDKAATGPLPDWCRPHFNPEAVFVLDAETERLPELDAAFEDFAEGYAALAAKAHGCVAEGSPALRAYKDHHIAHTPGLTFLNRTFGEEWTADFLRNGMYA